MNAKANVHAILPKSYVNGPGCRTVIWFQGCNLACPSCFNPLTHSFEANQLFSVEELLKECKTQPTIEGISLSGGEPLLQAEFLSHFLKLLKAESTLSVVVFSGFQLKEIEELPLGPAVLTYVDVLVSGRFILQKRIHDGLRSSTNQTLHLLSNRYSPTDLISTQTTEIMIDAQGVITSTGFF
jgi:anaerobic ribonucleoside-triphosphate reductase activating protein